MTPPPQYTALGGKAQSVLTAPYTFGLIKLAISLKTKSCIAFNLNAQSKQEDGLVTGSLETKYNWEKYGICIAEKINTESDLTTELSFTKLMEGLKLTTDATVNVKDGFKEAHLGLKYGDNWLALSADISTAPKIGASLVLGTRWNWFPGIQLEYDAQEKEVTKANVALDYIGDDFAFHTNVDNGNKFGGLIYQRVTDRVEAGIFVNFTSENKETEIGVGAKYNLDDDASVACRVNSQIQLGLGYRQKLRDGISLMLSTLIDCKNIQEGPEHKLGLAIEFQA